MFWDLIKPCVFKRLQSGVGDVGIFHYIKQCQGKDGAKEVIKIGAEIKPAPANDFKIRELAAPNVVSVCHIWFGAVT